MDILAEVFLKAEKKILEEIRSTNELVKLSRRQALLAQIQKILINTGKEVIPLIDHVSQTALDKENAKLKSLLDSKLQEFSFNLVNPKAVAAILDNIEQNYGDPKKDAKAVLSTSYQSIKKSINQIGRLGDEVIQKIAAGQIEGFGSDKLAREIRNFIKTESKKPVNILGEFAAKKLTEEGITAIEYVDKNGKTRTLSLQAYSKSLTRQILINSRASAVLGTSLERGFDLVKIDNHGNCSPMCRPWNGKIVSISGNNSDYPSLDSATFKGDYVEGGGIFHRYCRHSLTPYIQSGIKFNQ